MDEKRPCYDGYEERYMSGEDIYTYFSGCYERFGRHHERISSHQINFEKYYPKIKKDVEYRVFINDMFCKIMNSKTDGEVYFFGYSREKPRWAKD